MYAPAYLPFPAPPNFLQPAQPLLALTVAQALLGIKYLQRELRHGDAKASLPDSTCPESTLSIWSSSCPCLRDCPGASPKEAKNCFFITDCYWIFPASLFHLPLRKLQASGMLIQTIIHSSCLFLMAL